MILVGQDACCYDYDDENSHLQADCVVLIMSDKF